MGKTKQHLVRNNLATFYDTTVSVTDVLSILKERNVLIENAFLEYTALSDSDDRELVLFENRPETAEEKARRLALLTRRREAAKKSAERRKAAIDQREKKHLARLIKKHGIPR